MSNDSERPEREQSGMRTDDSLERDEDAPRAQSRVETEAVPAADPETLDPPAEPPVTPSPSDPMASIRPLLPMHASLVPETIPLSQMGDDSADALDAPTLAPPPKPTANRAANPAALETKDTGPVIPVLDPGAPPRDYEDGLAYLLLERIGAGGMGEVWEARQRELGRVVALKRLRSNRQSREIIELFKNEARLTALLDHPNIVTVHELGADQTGREFYTMRLIEGTPWNEVIATGRRRTSGGEVVRMDMRDHLEILVRVSQAIAFAHSRDVLHRDIKPANVVIGDYDEVQVVDWGLAVAMHERPGVRIWTKDQLPKGALVCGTPAYMSPETAKAEREHIGPATDVYLLGAVLFHLLYGRPPHQGKTVDGVIAQAKLNAWTIPEDDISARIKPWDALLRPVINRALATDPELRYPDAGEFGEAVRGAIRHYDSAKVASRAQEQLVNMQLRGVSGPDGYQRYAAVIARLEGALESWPGNLTARQTLAQARLDFAKLALANGDLALARLNVTAYEQLPPLPAPDSGSISRRLTMHPVDGTLISAPRPPDEMVDAGMSNRWASSLTPGGPSPLARTVGAAEMADMARGATLAPDGSSRRARVASSLGTGSLASVEIQQASDEAMLDEEQEHVATAARLLLDIGDQERGARRRRISVRVVASIVGVLLLAFAASVVFGQLALRSEHRRAEAERTQLSKVLLDETAKTVEAELAVVLVPVDTVLATALAWARAGVLDSDDPRELNRYYMPLLTGATASTSALRADTNGREYMLLRRPDGWRTRTTTPGSPRTMQAWTAAGELVDTWTSDEPYDPHTRPWYVGGAALRGASATAEVFWTDPYTFFTTGELGVSISAPVTSPSGREFVLAFDIKLGDLSNITADLPRDIEQGQVFVLDQSLRVLALPRELAQLEAQRREQLLLQPLAQIEEARISGAAVQQWQALRDNGPFRLSLGDGEADNYWVGFRLVDKPHRPRVWIGVVVPESHFLD